MHVHILPLLFCLVAASHAQAAREATVHQTQFAAAPTLAPLTPEYGAMLAARQNTCPVSCNTDQLGDEFDGLCCQPGQVCSVDASGDPACCPTGYVQFLLCEDHLQSCIETCHCHLL